MKMLLLISLIFTVLSGNIFPREENNFKDQIENYLNEQLKDYEKLEFQIVSSPSVKYDEKIVLDSGRQLKLSGNMAYVPVKISDKSGRYTQSLVSVKVKLYRKVLVAKKNIRYGTELKDYDFEEKLTDVAQQRGTALTDPEMLAGSKARISIRQGDILTKEIVQPLPILKNGERVSAIFSSGSVIITTDAVARQDGSAGDIIRIMTLDNKLFKAKVIDANSVKIIE